MSPNRRRRANLSKQGTNVGLLTLVWVLLNGSISPLTLLSGLLIAVLITLAFPLPPIEWSGRVRPRGVVMLLARLLLDLATASFSLAIMAFSRKPRPRSGVIAVPLNSDQDLYQIGTGSILSVVPGSVVVDARRKTRTLYLHIFDMGPEEAEPLKDGARRAEGRVMRALASNGELQRAREADSQRRAGQTPEVNR